MPFSLTTHIYSRKGGQAPVLTGVTPYVRLCKAGETPIFVQDGGFYSEGGEKLEPVPDWVWEEAAKLSEASLKEVKLTLPERGKPVRKIE